MKIVITAVGDDTEGLSQAENNGAYLGRSVHVKTGTAWRLGRKRGFWAKNTSSTIHNLPLHAARCADSRKSKAFGQAAMLVTSLPRPGTLPPVQAESEALRAISRCRRWLASLTVAGRTAVRCGPDPAHGTPRCSKASYRARATGSSLRPAHPPRRSGRTPHTGRPRPGA